MMQKWEKKGKLTSTNTMYLRACSLRYGGVCTFRGPRNALHHMLVLPQLGLTLLGSHHPHAHRLVIRAAGQQCAVLIGPDHTHPLPVTRERLHTVTEARWRASLDTDTQSSRMFCNALQKKKRQIMQLLVYRQ